MSRRHMMACAALACAGLGLIAAKSTAQPDMTGVWMAPMAVHEVGIPLQGGITPWSPESAGDPRKGHVPTLEEAKRRGDALAKIIRTGDPNATTPPEAPPPPFLTAAGVQTMRKFDHKLATEQELACYPDNVFNRIGGGLGPTMVVQNPKAIMMASAVNGDNYPRIVYLDGRTDADAVPSWEGFSRGRWSGSTLHVETTKIKGGYFNTNWPLSESARLIEDYRVVGAGKTRKLEILQKVVDPTNYKEPVTRVSYLDWRPDLLLQDFPCDEGRGDQIEVNLDKK